MKARRVVGILVAVVLALLVGWWLLRNTYLRYSKEPVSREVIHFAHSGGQEDLDFWRWAIAEFGRVHPDVRIQQDSVAGGGEQYGLRLHQQVLSQTLPEILLIPLMAFQELGESFDEVESGHEEPPRAGTPRSDLKSALEPTGVKAFEVHGRQRGLPFAGGNLLIFLNKKAFQKASEFHGKPVELPGPDWTVAQFLRTAEKLTCDFDRDGVTDQFGFWLPRWLYYLPFIWSFGADITDPSATRWTFSGPTAQAVMRFYRQLATGDRVAPREEEVPQLLQDTGFLTGKTAMCVNGPWFIAFLDKTDLARDYAVAPIPRGPGGRATRITWDGIVVRKGLAAPQREAVAKFTDWALSKEVQGRLARMGRALPARVDALPEFVAADPATHKPFVDALSYSRLQPPLPKFESLDRAITRHFDEAIDPNRAFEAMTMLDALARDPAVVSAFSESAPSP